MEAELGTQEVPKTAQLTLHPSATPPAACDGFSFRSDRDGPLPHASGVSG